MSRIVLAAAILVTAGAAQAQTAAITGSVTAPAGQSVVGASAFACPEPYDKCDTQSVGVDVQGAGRQGSYTLQGLSPDRRYQVMVWNDINRDQNPGPGDLLGMANGGQGVKPGAGVFDVALKVTGGAAAPTASSGGGSSSASGLAGRWIQSSTNTELVRVPVLKTMPSISAAGRGMVTSRAGGFTTVLRDEEKPMAIERSMELTIQPNGAFTLVTTTQRDASPTNSCKVIKRQEQRGQVQVSGDRLILASSGGSTQSGGSCGGSDGSSSDGPSTDVYTFRLSGSQLALNRSGGRDWVFQRR